MIKNLKFSYRKNIPQHNYCSVAQSYLTLCNLMGCSMPSVPVLYHLPEFSQIMSIESVMPSNHLVLCHPPLLLPSVFPSIRVFSNETALHVRWPKDWSFSFRISPSNEYSNLFSFRINWFGLLAERSNQKEYILISKCCI